MKHFYFTAFLLFLSFFSYAQWTNDVSKNTQVAGVNAVDIESIGVSGGKTWIAFYTLHNGNYDMRAQLLDSNGNRLLGNDGVLVSNKPSGSFTSVFNICINGQGDLIIGYQYEISGVINAVLSRVTQEGALPWGDGVVLGPGFSPYPAVLTTGETAVVWNNAILNTNSLRVIALDGSFAVAQARDIYIGISGTTTRGQVIANTLGTFTLVFQKPVTFINTTLAAQRFGHNLAPLSQPVQLSNQATSAARYYSLSAEADTTYVGYYSSIGVRFNAFLQRINPDAANMLPYGMNGIHFSNDTGLTDYYQQTVTIAQIDSTPTVWAVCTYSDVAQANYGIYAQRFLKTTGQKLLGDNAKKVLPVDFHMNMQEGELQLTGDDKAGFIFSDNQNQIYSTKLNNKGNIDSTVRTVLLASTSNPKSRIHFSGNDVMGVALWSENRNGSELPYAQNIRPDGATGVLPVTLGSFSGNWKDKAVILTWTTVIETNSEGFYIERSSDGKAFSSLGYVAAKKDNAGGSNLYSFTDLQPLAKTGYYRLRIADINGSGTYSKTVVMTANSTGLLKTAKVYPNPVKNILYVEMESIVSTRVTAIITNAAGKVIMQKSLAVSEGVNRLPLSVSSLASGAYFITITRDNGIQTGLKFNKQ